MIPETALRIEAGQSFDYPSTPYRQGLKVRNNAPVPVYIDVKLSFFEVIVGNDRPAQEAPPCQQK